MFSTYIILFYFFWSVCVCPGCISYRPSHFPSSKGVEYIYSYKDIILVLSAGCVGKLN